MTKYKKMQKKHNKKYNIEQNSKIKYQTKCEIEYKIT